MDTRIVNKNFRIVFQEKRPPTQKRARYLVGAGRLHLYIGRELADKYISKAMKSKGDKIEFNARKTGKVIFYTK